MNVSYIDAVSSAKPDVLNGSQKAALVLASSAIKELFPEGGEGAVAKFASKPDSDSINYIVSKALEFVNKGEVEFFHSDFVQPLQQFIARGV